MINFERCRMRYEFDWQIQIEPQTARLLEGDIRALLTRWPEHCREQFVKVTLSQPAFDPYDDEIAGTVKCQCGALTGEIKGKSDRSERLMILPPDTGQE